MEKTSEKRNLYLLNDAILYKIPCWDSTKKQKSPRRKKVRVSLREGDKMEYYEKKTCFEKCT